MDEHPALALREKKDSSILVATDLVRRGEADAVVTAGHTGAGMAAAVLRLGRLPGVDRPALAVQMITSSGPMVLLDIGANPDSTAENLVQYAQMGAIFAERVLGVARPARRAPLDRRGEGQGRRPDRPRDRAARRDGPALRGQRRGQGPDHASGRRGRLRRGPRQRGHQVLRRPVRLHLRPVAGGVPAGRPRAPGLRPDEARRRSDPRRLRLRAARWLAAARGQGDRDHHPRSGEAPDDRLRLRGGGHDRPPARARADRGVARAGAASAGRPRRPTSPRRPSHERSRADGRHLGHRRAGPARRPRGARGRAGRARRGAVAASARRAGRHRPAA